MNGTAGRRTNVSKNEILGFIERAKRLLREDPEIKGVDRNLLTRDQLFNIPNLESHSEMFQWAGIDFGEENIYMIQKSLKRLAVMSGAKSLRFFGKIFGTERDYWVAQGTLAFEEEPPNNTTQESRNVGANTHVFWVTHNLLTDWI